MRGASGLQRLGSMRRSCREYTRFLPNSQKCDPGVTYFYLTVRNRTRGDCHHHERLSMQRTKPILALILSTLLSGCFASDNPMFAPETAVLALEPGRYG